MNPTVTSKEEIIAACQKIAKERGLEAISIRSVASEWFRLQLFFL